MEPTGAVNRRPPSASGGFHRHRAQTRGAGVARILDAVEVEPGTRALAEAAGLALATVGAGPSAADAIVMASAAQRNDVVYTSDFDDLSRLQAHFPGVRVLRV